MYDARIRRLGILYQNLSVIIALDVIIPNTWGSSMRKLKQFRTFLNHYRLLSVVLGAALIGGVFDIAGYDTLSHWILGGAAAIAVIPLVWNMIETLRNGSFGVDLLAATAIVTSIIMKEYWAAIVIVIMLTGGEALEAYAERRAKTELHDLLERKPTKAHVIRGRKTIEIPASQVVAGDKLAIYPGEVVPVDAVIIEGSTSLDESSLTGESIPVEKSVDGEILSGSINIDGAITVRATRAAKESQYAQIIKLVKSAAAGQSPFVRLADAYSIPFTAVSFIIAGSAWAISGDSLRFLQVLVVATPCPLLLGAPIALISGMSRATKQGIIIKTGSALERLAAAKTFAFDKTGTLTVGKPAVSKIETYGPFTEETVLSYAASLEATSTHVLADAIVEAAENRGLKVKKAKHVKESAGHGLTGHLDGKEVLVGRFSMIKEAEITLPKNFKENHLKHTSTLVAVDGKLAGIILFKDEIRKEAPKMLRQLKKDGIKHFALVTGDNEATAVKIAQELNIVDVYPECLPADKLTAVQELPHWPVVFVGDGVNDAPVLTAADVGIALGARGSTAASESADVVIMQDDVSKVADSFAISKRTLFIAKQSIMIGIGLSVALMLIFATGKFKPVYGAAIQEVVDIAVIFNALRAHGGFGAKKRLSRVGSKLRQLREV